MAKTQTKTREDWPWWAVARIECANCGKEEAHATSAPHHASPGFVDWVREAWPSGNSQQTRMGFKIWCSGRCESAWKHANWRFLENIKSDGHAHKLKIWQEEKAWKHGLVN